MERLDEALSAYLDSKAKAGDSGNYRRTAERVVGRWIAWCGERAPPVDRVDEVEVRLLRRYARHLRRRTASGAIVGSTAHTYYAQVRAFLSWCVREELLAENPAKKRRATEELPDESAGKTGDGGPDQQFWSPDQREAIVRYVDDRAHEAIDDHGSAAVVETRDRALVTLLAYAGVRGGEVLRSATDDRRRGLRWRAVDLDAGTARLLGKSQEREVAALPEQTRDPLAIHRRVLAPPTPDWPVFPTRHAPTLYRTVRERLPDRGWDEAEIEAALGDTGPTAVLRTAEVPPPSLTTAAGRTLLRRLTDEAGIKVEGEHDYLTLHGARRGVGEAVYRTHGAAAAQRTLRHSDPATTAEMYTHVEASELAEEISDAFD